MGFGGTIRAVVRHLRRNALGYRSGELADAPHAVVPSTRRPPLANALLILIIILTCLTFVSAAQADTLDWSTRTNGFDLRAGTDSVNINGTTVTTHTVSTGTYESSGLASPTSLIRTGTPPSGFWTNTGTVEIYMNATADDESVYQVTTITFSRPVTNFALTVIDIDGGPACTNCTFNDIVEFNSNNGLPTSVSNQGSAVAYNSLTGRASASANLSDTGANTNITVNWSVPVTSVTIKHIAGDVAGTNPNQQVIGIEDLTFGGTVKLQKITQGGTGTFSYTRTNLASAPANITTTTPGVAAPASPTAIAITASGTAVTLTETPAAGYVATSASCTDANSSYTGNTGSIGTLAGNVLTIAAANAHPASDFTCVYTNTRTPTVKTQKTTIGGVGGPFSFTQTNLASAPANITTTTAGTPAPATPAAINVTTIGTAVTLTETPAAGYALTAASCTDANSAVTGNTGSIGTRSGNTLTIPAANVVAGADFTCVFTNTRATVKVQKITTGSVGGPFSFAQTNLASAPANITTTVAGTPAPAAPTAINVTTIGTAVTLTETPAAGYGLVSASCTDANSAVTGNTGSIGTVAGNVLTIPAANVKAGSDFTCVFTNARATVKVQKTTAGGFGGPFGFAQTNLASAPGNITTTAVGTPTPASPAAINVTTLGTAVTVTETPATGYVLSSASCTDTNSAVTGNTGSIGTLAGNILTIPATNVKAGADFNCVFTNSLRPTVKVQKTTTGGFGGPFSFAQTNLASAPGNITTAAADTPTPATPTAINVTTIGTAATLTETPAAGYALTAASCTDANSVVTGNTGSVGSLSGNVLTIPAVNVVAGADFTCVFTNTRAKVRVQKQTTGGFGGPFSFAQTNLASAPANITTTAVGTPTPASPAAINVTTIGTAVTVTETPAAGYVLTAASCTDANSAVTGNTGSIGTLSGNVLTIPAANVKAGTDFTCLFTNTKRPTVKVQKTTTGGIGGPFSFAQTNLASAPANITTAAVGTPTPASPAAINVTTIGAAVTVTETPASGYTLTSASCTDANGGVTGNTGAVGSLSGNVLTIPAANVVAGADLTCVFTNAKTPTVKVQKTTAAGFGGPFSFAQTNLTSAPAAITTTAAGTPTPASPTAINVTTIGTAVTLTETPAAGYALAAASCTDANSGITGNSGAIGSLAGTVLTIPAANVNAGADYTCVFTNAKLPTLQLTKTSIGASGSFSFTGDNGFGADTIVTPGTTGGTQTGAVKTLTSASVITTVTETIPAGWVATSGTCTGTAAGNIGFNPAATATTATITLNATATAPGNVLNCTFTNTKLPTVTVTKISNGGTGAFSFTGTNGFGSDAITTLSSGGSGTSGSVHTLAAASTATSITETAPPGSFVLAAISCSGLGAGGTATPNLVTATINLDAAATAPGANISCTFTNGLPGLTVTKTGTLNDGGDGIANAGDTISYSFTITNTGTVALTNVSASDPGALISGGPIASLAPGAVDSTTITGLHTLTQAEIDTGSYANTVTISGNPPTGPPATANDTETVTLVSVPTFTVVKTQSAGPNPVTTLPATLTYTITVDNTGNRTLTAPTISDSLTQGVNILTLTSGPSLTSGDTNSDNKLDTTEIWVYTASYAVTQANLDHGGNIVNTATFDSAESTPVNSAPVTTPITQGPQLTITKTASPNVNVAAGQVVTYTYTVTNSGNVTISGVNISDIHNGTGTPPSPANETLTDNAPLGDSTDAVANNGTWSVLAPGDTVVFTANYTVTQNDLDTLQ